MSQGEPLEPLAVRFVNTPCKHRHSLPSSKEWPGPSLSATGLILLWEAYCSAASRPIFFSRIGAGDDRRFPHLPDYVFFSGAKQTAGLNPQRGWDCWQRIHGQWPRE